MIPVMIVDDDVFLRERLKSIINWETLGLRYVGEAGDSDTAREMFFEYHPKIVITDIHIPFISGLELARELSELDPDIRIIIITGFTDFSYAKEAVKLGAVEFMSKPLSQDEVEASLRKAVAFFEQLRKDQAAKLALKQMREQNTRTMREKYAGYLLRGAGSGRRGSPYLEAFRADLPGPCFVALQFRLQIDALGLREYGTYLLAVRGICRKLFSKSSFAPFFYDGGNHQMCCVISLQSPEQENLVEEIANQAVHTLEFYYELKLCAGVGRLVKQRDSICISAYEAETALRHADLKSETVVIHYKDISIADSRMEMETERLLPELVTLFRMNEKDMLYRRLQEQYAFFRSSEASAATVKTFSLDCAAQLIGCALSLGLDVNSGLHFLEKLSGLSAYDEIDSQNGFMREITDKMLDAIFRKRSEKQNLLIEVSKNFVEENLGNEKLNLEMVSAHVGFSRIYFCKLFHKTENISFNQYLNMRRIKLAKTLLAQTNKKVFEISCEVGYGNPKHFGYMFKRITSLSPLEYRKQAAKFYADKPEEKSSLPPQLVNEPSHFYQPKNERDT